MENTSCLSMASDPIVKDCSGRYVYGIVAGSEIIEMGSIGIENSRVYSIPYQNICAIVHNCGKEPYESTDDEVVKSWVEAHNGVVDTVERQLGTIIPLGFDTIIRSQDNALYPDQVVRDWLRKDYGRLVAIMDKIKGKDEYGVQIFLDSGSAERQIFEQSDEIRQIKKEIASKSPGAAYFWRQKLEKAMKSETERLADKWSRDLYETIKRKSDDIVVEKTRNVPKEKVMVLDLSCLVDKERVEELGQELERINNVEGFTVRFSGPWPPYSFVDRSSKPVEEG